jgi:hypothetical protein
MSDFVEECPVIIAETPPGRAATWLVPPRIVDCVVVSPRKSRRAISDSGATRSSDRQKSPRRSVQINSNRPSLLS